MQESTHHEHRRPAARPNPPEKSTSLLHQFGVIGLLGAGMMYITYVLGQCDYGLFRALVDLIGVLVALAIFMVTWHTRRFASDDAGTFLGVAYLWVGILQGFYLLAFGWPPPAGDQFTTVGLHTWTAARLLEAGALAGFPFLIGKRLPRWLIHLAIGSAGLAALSWVYGGDEIRLTATLDSGRCLFFSLFAIFTCVLFAVASVGVLRKRSRFDNEVAMLLLCSLALNLMAESIFALTPMRGFSPWGIVPSLSRLVAEILLYKALVSTCLSRPYAMLFHGLRLRDRGLFESRRRYMSVVEDVPVMICSMRPDGIITFANSLFCSTFGLSRGKNCTGRSFLAHLPEAVKPTVERAIGSLSPAQPVTSCEHEVLLADGTRRLHRWRHRGQFDAAGTLIGLQSCGEDITEQVRAREHVDRLAAAVEQAPVAITIMDGNGRILYVNPAFETLSGYAADEVLGNRIEHFVHCDNKKELLAEIFSVVSRGGIWRGHVSNRTKQGAAYEEELIVTGRRNESGILTDMVAVGRDVTREMEMTRQLHQMQKMDALGRLAGGVAHDFNNVLQIMAANAELGLDEAAPDSVLIPRLRDILTAARKAETVVKQLLTFNRPREGPREAVRLSETVRQFAPLAERVLGAHIRMHIDIEENARPILADPIEIEQALLNLAVNARDAMPDGGRIDIRVRAARFTAEQCIELTWAREGEYTVLEVEDNGSGMPPEVIERVFEPFFTTKPVGQGTGLGLALVYGMIERYGGFIHLTSEPGRGTCVALYLPVTARPPTGKPDNPDEETRAAAPPLSLPELPAGRKILLAEDNAMVRRVAARVLGNAGYAVIEARDGREALRLFREHRDELVGLILDVMMPGANGREVWTEVRREFPGLPVLFCTGYNDCDLGDAVLGDGHVAIIQKPYQRRELLEALGDLLTRRGKNSGPS